jgi:hypothetical protein
MRRIMDSRNPWDRQPDESARAFEARREYIEMGASRSLAAVGQKLAKSRQLLSRWSARWRWVESAAAFDAMRDAELTRAVVEAHAKKAREDAVKWARRLDELPELQYTAFVEAYKDLVQYVEDVKAGKIVASIRDKAMLIRSLVRMSPMADRAVEVATRRHATATAAQSAATPPIARSGRAKAALQAFHDYKGDEDEDGP